MATFEVIDTDTITITYSARELDVLEQRLNTARTQHPGEVTKELYRVANDARFNRNAKVLGFTAEDLDMDATETDEDTTDQT